MTEEVVRKAWDQKSGLCDPLFGGRADQIDLSSQHPEPSQIFRLWQTYLDNVDPLLKITHTPSLQARIIEAITNLKQIDPQLEVLMFGIYCIAIGSLMSDECQALLGAPREELLSQYQHSCREALVRCEFLRSDKLDCLTGLYFYLVRLFGSMLLLYTDDTRCPCDLYLGTLEHYRLCLASQFARPNVWVFIASPPALDILHWKRNCVEGSGGPWFCLIHESQRWRPTEPPLSPLFGTARFRAT